MFYTVVAGWMLAYVYKSATGAFVGQTAEGVGNVFGALLANPGELIFWMMVVIVIGLACCAAGLQKGVERVDVSAVRGREGPAEESETFDLHKSVEMFRRSARVDSL